MTTTWHDTTVILTIDSRLPILVGSVHKIYFARAASHSFVKAASKSVHPYGWNIVDRQTGMY